MNSMREVSIPHPIFDAHEVGNHLVAKLGGEADDASGAGVGVRQ